MIRPNSTIDAISAGEPFIGPERIMRERGLDSMLRLGANESAFGPSPRAIAAMSAELPHLAWYGDPDSHALRGALAERWATLLDDILITSGIDELLGLVVRCYLEPGETAVTAAGTYPTFAYHVLGYGGRVESVAYCEDGTIDLDALASAAQRCNAAICYLANPDNPSGSFVDAEAIARFRAALPARTLLLLDEAYAEFADPASVPERRAMLGIVRARTFSKLYGMAGARIGYAVAPQALLAPLLKVRLQYGVNRNAQIGALASLDDEAFARDVLERTARGRTAYAALGRELGLSTLPSATNFVCFDCSSRERAEEVLEALLRRGVWTRKPGRAPLDRFVRVTVGDEATQARFAADLRAVCSRVTA
ncbi:MAG: aminotransferase class I/II-fold pyridoxal phosphate-dependent enzyme [Candidatus Eremiobacteraeota bacterium]|nr:aminotransferase class I/II-fold pyridoxal phosphate-dependent enzyme [Candidatus Eremiobacteraeota bacterium]